MSLSNFVDLNMCYIKLYMSACIVNLKKEVDTAAGISLAWFYREYC
jgi:hypothetical protein